MNAHVIDNSENKASVISCSPSDLQISDVDKSLVVGVDKLQVVSDFIEKDVATEQQFKDINIIENFTDTCGIKQLDDVIETDKNLDPESCSVDNGKLYETVPSSLDMHCEAAIYSRHVTDKTPLLKDGLSVTGSCSDGITEEENKTPLLQDGSSVTGSCSDGITEGENETSETTSCECSYLGDKDSDQCSLNNMSVTSQTRESLMTPGSIRAPIVGHEIVEARTKFTVFKIHVAVEADDVGWFIFRRYSDFVHLNDELKMLFPNFRLSLPPKRWFRSNFDSEFLEERLLGLQAFVDNVTGHRDICNSKPMRDFFCFDNPPGPHDSLKESRAQCECMEEMLYTLRNELVDKDSEIHLLKEELDLYKNQVKMLSSRLSELNRRSSLEKPGSEKHRSPSSARQISINALKEPGDPLFTNKVESVNKSKNPDLRRNERLPSSDM